MNLRDWFDFLSAAFWFTLAIVGIVLRIRRMIRLHRIRLPEPIDQRDVEYLASVRHSTYLRLGVKVVFLLGSLIALFDLTILWAVWRVGIVLALSFMLFETLGVDRVRDRLGRPIIEGGA